MTKKLRIINNSKPKKAAFIPPYEKGHKQFPSDLNTSLEFGTPIWSAYVPEFVNGLNKASDPYIKAAQKNLQDDVKQRTKKFGDKKDRGYVYHSTTLVNKPGFEKLNKYVVATAYNFLDQIGFDMSNYQMALTEMWVQEFSRNGGGFHSPHVHWNGHVSGFYFLKAGEETTRPVFHDPRPGHVMNSLPQKDITKITPSSSLLNYACKPGTMIFFPSYLAHEYPPDLGYAPFRFIHWNCQAFPRNIMNIQNNENN